MNLYVVESSAAVKNDHSFFYTAPHVLTNAYLIEYISRVYKAAGA
jgi:hypothetical protein